MIFYLSGYTAVWKCTALFLLPATSTSSQLCRQTLHCDDAAGFKVYFPWLKDSFKIWNLHGTKMNHRLIINLVFCLRCHVDSFTHLSFIIALCGENTFWCRGGILSCNCLQLSQLCAGLNVHIWDPNLTPWTGPEAMRGTCWKRHKGSTPLSK